jgi:TonB family protein
VSSGNAAADLNFLKFGLVLFALGLISNPAKAATKQVPQALEPSAIVLKPRVAARLLLNNLAPEYPAVAKVNYIRGHVNVELEVGPDGKVSAAHVLQGNPILAAAALKAVRDWVYRPLVTTHGPSGFVTDVDLKFNMNMNAVYLRPARAERDLTRQVKPPKIIRRTGDDSAGAGVRVRVLVDELGHVIDYESWPGAANRLEAVQKTVETLTFRPAHWGAIPVPWYIDVDVPSVR